jgi:uncharacterized FAD-dependent dehydrogenase
MRSASTGNDPIQIVRSIEGLFLAGDTVRARGMANKAARSGISAAEAVLDRRLGHFASAVRH